MKRSLKAVSVICSTGALVAAGAVAILPGGGGLSPAVAATTSMTTRGTYGDMTVSSSTTTRGTYGDMTVSSTTSRTTTSTIICDAMPPRATLASATTTSLTFTYTSYGYQCGHPGTTYISVGTENGNSASVVSTGSNSANSGEITVTGLMPGTYYYFYTSGGGSPFGGSWSGPVNTLPEGSGSITSPTCATPAPSGLTMTKLAFPAGYTNVNIVAVNAKGVVLGNATSGGVFHPVLWDANGVLSDLPVLPGGNYATADAINDAGVVVGTGANASQVGRAVVWRNGKITDLGTLGGTGSAAKGVAADGTVLGYASDSNSNSHAVKWDARNRISVLRGLGGTSSVDVTNDLCAAVGSASTSGLQATHSVYWDRSGRLTDFSSDYHWAIGLNNLGVAVFSSGERWDRARGLVTLPLPSGVGGATPLGINDAGTVFGAAWSSTTTGGELTVRWNAAGVPTVLPNLPGRTVGQPEAINASGDIVGSVALYNNVPHAVRWAADGTVADLGGVTGCDRSYAFAVNDSGVIVGTVRYFGTTEYLPVVWR